jgi:sigma-B regulation protein RsbU (phosphoserine phosphatase)
MTANFVIIALNTAVPLFSSSGASAEFARWVFLAVFALPLGIAMGGLIRRQRFEFTPQTTPAHILRITERERMAKELEIARRVQMSLLPKVNPVVPGYDIAGVCLPALEVGGDYYDFVMLGGRKIGIAIGDVSGKGVPAAIYMTLTKGILQSHAEDNISPKVVLSKVNSLMYKTIERNSFVSMFYAILDVQQMSIRFARAGQCPVIVAQRSGEEGKFLTPKGMALGLENGRIFDSVLEEQELDLQSGEVLVFYTDGFTEAMAPSGDEFGEQRLVDSIARHRSKPAHNMILGICGDVQRHIAERPQHDDMTMVVVKVA